MNYRRGANRERQVMHNLMAEGWFVVRSAGSHSSADLVALRNKEIKLIQVKCTKSKWSGFGPLERLLLASDAYIAGGTPLLAWWPPNGKLQWIGKDKWPNGIVRDPVSSYHVISRLKRIITPTSLPQWLKTPLIALNDKTPLDTIRFGSGDEFLELLKIIGVLEDPGAV